MKRGFLLPIILPALMLTGCQKERGVYAGSDAYHPRPAAAQKKSPAQQDIYGELLRLDLPKNTFVVRVENGMEQTFKFDDNIVVRGLGDPEPTIRDLVGKEGSEVIVQWQQDEDGGKLASRIDVTQVITSKKVRRRR
jgi:hypothetical protein